MKLLPMPPILARALLSTAVLCRSKQEEEKQEGPLAAPAVEAEATPLLTGTPMRGNATTGLDTAPAPVLWYVADRLSG